MQNAWVLNQEILINPELYHPSTMPKRTHVELKKAIRMLQANVTPSVIAQQLPCKDDWTS